MPQIMNLKVQVAPALVLAVSLGLSACATPEDMRARPPTATLMTQRAAADVATCIADRWDNETFLGVPVAVYGLRARATATGHIITVVNQHGGVMYMADVLARGADSKTNYYDYYVQDPSKVASNLPAHYSLGPVQPPPPYISGMHKAVIECSK